MTTYATTAELAVKLQRALSVPEEASAAVHLEEGSALLRVQVPGLAAALALGTVDSVLVRKVLTDAVARVMRNPAGVTTQVVGPESATFSGLAQRAEVAFLPAELAMVTPPSAGVSVGGFAIGSFRLRRPDYCSPDRPFVSERWC